MYAAAESEAQVAYQGTLLVDKHQYFINVFIPEAPIEENTTSEYIRPVATMYSCTILQLRIRSELRIIPQEYQLRGAIILTTQNFDPA